MHITNQKFSFDIPIYGRKFSKYFHGTWSSCNILMCCWLLLQIYLCYLWLVLWSKVTYNINRKQRFYNKKRPVIAHLENWSVHWNESFEWTDSLKGIRAERDEERRPLPGAKRRRVERWSRAQLHQPIETQGRDDAVTPTYLNLTVFRSCGVVDRGSISY